MGPAAYLVVGMYLLLSLSSQAISHPVAGYERDGVSTKPSNLALGEMEEVDGSVTEYLQRRLDGARPVWDAPKLHRRQLKSFGRTPLSVESEDEGDEEYEEEDGEDEGDLPETNNKDLDQIHEPQEEPKISASSRVLPQRSKMDSGKEFRGVDGGVVDRANITHLSYMVFKLIKKHEITSVIDMPCRNTLNWFPLLLHRLDFEVAGFKYYCVDSEKHSQDDIRHLFGDAGSPEFMHIRPEESSQLPKADLLFSWNGPQEWGVRKTWAFFNGIREVRPNYLIITNNPGSNNANANHGLLNVRKQPFHFLQAKRVISNMQVEEDAPKQLLMYEMDGIRHGF